MTPESGRLESWKEIAAYLNRDVRTARRWEKERSLPVHRAPGKRSGVYALVTEVDAWLKAGSARAAAPAQVESPPPARLPWLSLRWIAPNSILLVIAVLAILPRPTSPAPRLGHIVAVTNDGLMNGRPLPGWHSLFYISRGGERSVLKRIGEKGETQGETLGAFLPMYRFDLLSRSHDDSQILTTEYDTGGCQSPLWVMPAVGGAPRRLPGICASAAAWSPDGRRLAFATGTDLYLGNSDGTHSRQLAALQFGLARGLCWSPDGKRVRFILGEREGNRQLDRLWELALGDDKCRRLLPGWSRSSTDQEGGGQWTPDGRFFIFPAIHDGISAIWCVSDRHGVLAPGVNMPAQLTAVPGGVSGVAASPDGKRIYAAITLPQRCEVVRFEPSTAQFAAYRQMEGISAGQLAFSPDRNQIAYMGYPDERLWKMNSDGTNRRSLSERGALPQWSPNGRSIAFMGWDRPNDRTTIRLISLAGGAIQKPVSWPGWQGAPNWTRNGSQLIFGENGPVNPIPASCRLHAFDFKSGRTTDLPGTVGLWTARTDPATDRYIAAMTNDNRKLILYDRRKASLTELLVSADGPFGDNPVWSKDGKFIYMDVPFPREPAVYRVRVADKKIELVANLHGLRRTTSSVGLWIGLTPDGSLLTLRELQGSEIYSWDLLPPQ